ncbi:MAG TPA: protein kinase [Kofleriaceae bacterium]|nr:protein kinase [Kofleriaceae bacterium]
MKSVLHMSINPEQESLATLVTSESTSIGASPAAVPHDTADPLLAAGTPIGDFRICGFLGEGAMGQVYLAQDVTLGRSVALKLIKRSIMKGDAVARFLDEARATARLNHAHIVTIHAIGEHEGRPYLALEYIEGESLRARLAAGPLTLRVALRYARAIAEAVAEAHRRGLVHADLKPENIVIPQDGRLRVVDFGVARFVGSTPKTVSGTPLYMAPERWRGEPPTGAIDVWSLGLLLHELVMGRRPLPDGALMKLSFSSQPLGALSLPSEAWAALVRDCLAYDPAARPTAEAVVRRITALLDPRAVPADAARCPFPGLAAFSRERASDYFGRQAELDALVERLRTRALIPVVGPSGIGKSSFVHAALLPRLEEAERWVAISLRPGASPFDSLATALALPGRSALVIAESLRRYPDSLSLILDDVAKHHRARVLLFVDQFEETFTLAAGSAESVAFCECLARADVAAASWRVVLTLRDDFLGRLAAAPAMRPHLSAVMHLGPLTTADLRAAITGPLDNAGYTPDAIALVERIVGDVAGQAACLPLLQFACQSLWERRDVAARRVLAAEYEAMGGATGALASHAQRLLAELSPDEVRLVRGLMLALVHPDGPRRPCGRAALLGGVPAGSRATADGLLDRLLERRLLVATRDDEQGTTTLEIAHEALAQAWPQLARWLDETREERVLAADLEQAAQLWQRRGRSDAETWSESALAEAVRKVDAWNIALSANASAFLRASTRRERRAQRRRRQIAGGIAAALAAVTFGSVAAAVTIAQKSEELSRAAIDLGRIELLLTPFDWDPVQQRRLAPTVLPPLEWRIYAPSPDDPREPGRPYDGQSLRRGSRAWRSGVLVEDVEVRSGPAFIEIRGRGGDCAPSVLYLQRLPGYRERAAPRRIELAVPTCQASWADTVRIPAGPFLRAVTRDGQELDERAALPAYAIDRTEVTRGAFAAFEGMKSLTGVRISPTRFLIGNLGGAGQAPLAGSRVPISGIDHDIARSYCRYLGKDLPTADQWQKAFRGGLLLVGGEPNLAPARATPAGEPVVLGHDLAAVGRLPGDTSPYGVLDLAGNVSEWSLDRSSTYEGLRRIHGGSWASPPGAGHERIYFANTRPEEARDYSVGVRCVTAGGGGGGGGGAGAGEGEGEGEGESWILVSTRLAKNHQSRE